MAFFVVYACFGKIYSQTNGLAYILAKSKTAGETLHAPSTKRPTNLIEFRL